MTPEQFDHWKDFAIRAARTKWPRRRPRYESRHRPTRDWIVEQVIAIFDQLDPEDIPYLVGWDHSEPYPPEHPYYHVDHLGTPWHPPIMCDWMGEWEMCIYYNLDDYASQREMHRIDVAREREHYGTADQLTQCVIDRWADPVRCCIRAGMDLASAPSMGVLGFTAGDLRRMYPEGVPDWVTGGNEQWDTVPITGVVRGVGFTCGEAEVDGTFAEMPDEAELWL